MEAKQASEVRKCPKGTQEVMHKDLPCGGFYASYGNGIIVYIAPFSLYAMRQKEEFIRNLEDLLTNNELNERACRK